MPRRRLDGDHGFDLAVVAASLAIALGLGSILLGCQSGRSAQPSNRNEPPAMDAPAPCRAVLTPASDGEYGLRFELSNPTSHAIALNTYKPFLQFHVRAAANGAALAVNEPALDIPVQPQTIAVPASGTVEIVTPVRLRLRPGVPPSQQQFVWSITHEPKGVELTFTLDLPPPFDQPFTAQVVPE